jgi:hypothetical protein
VLKVKVIDISVNVAVDISALLFVVVNEYQKSSSGKLQGTVK